MKHTSCLSFCGKASSLHSSSHREISLAFKKLLRAPAQEDKHRLQCGMGSHHSLAEGSLYREPSLHDPLPASVGPRALSWSCACSPIARGYKLSRGAFSYILAVMCRGTAQASSWHGRRKRCPLWAGRDRNRAHAKGQVAVVHPGVLALRSMLQASDGHELQK